MNQKLLLIFFLGIIQLLSAQKTTYKIPDSLHSKSYEYLDDKIYELKKDSSKAAVYMYTYLNKARKEQNWKEIVNAYQSLLHQSPDNLRLVYADSMIYSAKKSNDDALIGSAYLSKGIVYYGQKKQILALDNYIIANNYISKTSDNYLTYKVKYHIALIKYYLGFYDEGISLLKECIVYFKEDENPRPYLNSLHSL
jgi:tetratricopeptide (TPR) repeat protein